MILAWYNSAIFTNSITAVLEWCQFWSHAFWFCIFYSSLESKIETVNKELDETKEENLEMKAKLEGKFLKAIHSVIY